MARPLLFAALLLLAQSAAIRAADSAIWIEGEQPHGGTMPAHWVIDGGVERPAYLSGGKWLKLFVAAEQADKVVADGGAVASWDFTVASAGHYQIWERYGLESIRSPFSWRIDGKDWTDIPALSHPYYDLMDAGVWCEICWTQLGEADLAAGPHAIEIKVDRQYDKDNKPRNLMACVDCFCIAPSFHPDGAHQPGEPWQSDQDRAAAAKVYSVPAAQADERVAVSLAGPWQVARLDEFEPAARAQPDAAVPPVDQLIWSAIPVPGDKHRSRPDLNLAHRVVYRARIDIPAALAGHSFALHTGGINMIASAFVNGVPCGGTTAMCCDWDCDLTPGIKPGTVNELEVVIKDTHYALSPQKAKTPWSKLALTPVSVMSANWVGQHMDFPVNSVHECGFIETPSLVVCGAAYASDVFAKPSVSKKSLDLEVTLANPTDAEVAATLSASIEPEAGGAQEKSFAAQQVKLAPHASQVVTLSEPWANPRLWWPDDPFMYRAVTTVAVPGKPADVRRTPFGFREWDWSTEAFKLNGIPWHLRADTSEWHGSFAERVAHLKQNGQNTYRMFSRTCWGVGQNAALAQFDHDGMIIRHTSIFDGEGANYLGGLVDQALFDHYTEYLRGWCRSERNHPSLLIWSIENEITYINSRNLGLSARVEPMMAKAAKAMMAMDPTRPVMVDGGRCLISEDLPVNGCHYDETEWREYPEEAYTYERVMKSHLQPFNGFGRSPWRMVPGRPIFHGESYFLNGYRPSELSEWGGEEAFAGWAGAKRGGGLFARILTEGDRWHGVAAFEFSLSEDEVAPYYNSFKPIIALVREWDWTFAAGSQVSRSIKVLNDTRLPDPIQLTWSLTVDGKAAAGASKSYAVPCGEAVPDTITFALPQVASRTAANLSLSCAVDGKEVFHDDKPIAIIAPDADPMPPLAAGELAVIDPRGSVAARLTKRGIAFAAVKSVDEVPASARVVVVGADALDALAASGNQWLAIAARGGRVLVLDQGHPLRGAAVPADMDPSGRTGRVAFAENLQHPVFAGLDQPDFFTWGGDEIVYRDAYTKPTHGAISLAQCDSSLDYSALAEAQVNDGLLLMCQLAVGSKLGDDAVAQKLFDNMLAYCATYVPARKPTAVALDEATPRGRLLADSGLSCTHAGDALAAITGGKAQIVVFDATPGNLKLLAGDLETVKAFTAKGGWLFAWGLTPEGLKDFNALVGVDHLIRPFRRERVTLPASRDPVLSGITLADVVLDSGKPIAPWMGQHWAADDTFSYVVDLDDIAPFLTYPPWQFFNPGKKEPDLDKDPYNLVNGFSQTDDWRYILQLPAKAPFLEWDVELPRTETPTQLDIINNGNYRLLDRIELTYDTDPANPVAVQIQPQKDILQSIALPPKPVGKIHVKLASWAESQAPAVIGIDNWWIHVMRSPDFYAKVKPLLNIGALVKYPRGAGGVILCELNVPERETVPGNGPRRQALVSALLRNLGAVFAGSKTIAAGANLACQPVPLGEACNLFLSKDKGWFTDERDDLSQFPSGDCKLAAVSYQVRDIRTSPLPNAISLAGGKLRTPVPAAVTGIAVGRVADALFFLHTFKQAKPWQAPQKGDRTPPAAWDYIVHYADGQTATIPVRLNDDVASWLEEHPLGLKGAVVAWTCQFDGDKRQGTVYQMQWTNPRPAAPIATIDIAYDPALKVGYGEPIVIGITTATVTK